MEELKSDEAYGYNISLDQNRKLKLGHMHFGNKTEVDVLKEILDTYMDTSTFESASTIADHKMDFGITVLDSMIIILMKKYKETAAYFNQLETQLSDISHRMLKPNLSGQKLTAEEKIEIYDMQTDILVKRRNLKDALSIQKVTIDNLEKTRNFILTMNQRMYKPKSDRFQNNKDFFIDKSANNTRVNTSRSE